MCLVSSNFWHRAPQIWNFLSAESNEVTFRYVNVVALHPTGDQLPRDLILYLRCAELLSGI